MTKCCQEALFYPNIEGLFNYFDLYTEYIVIFNMTLQDGYTIPYFLFLFLF